MARTIKIKRVFLPHPLPSVSFADEHVAHPWMSPFFARFFDTIREAERERPYGLLDPDAEMCTCAVPFCWPHGTSTRFRWICWNCDRPCSRIFAEYQRSAHLDGFHWDAFGVLRRDADIRVRPFVEPAQSGQGSLF